MSKKKKTLLIIFLILGIWILQGLIVLGLIYFSYESAKVEVNTDINKYNDYIGVNAKEGYRNKWDLNEEIFPLSITSNMNVIDYKMVYYNPWDAQYLSYLVVDYNDDDYEIESSRLKNYNSTNYVGYYGVNGFSKYHLLAIEADFYHGFVYALTDNSNRIIYVEMIFCNYFMNLDYEKYIDSNYLPDGFDAKENNSYMKKMLEKYS